MKKFLSLMVFALACGGAEEAVSRHETWAQFEERSRHVEDGHVLYRVEDDIAVSHEGLRAYYDHNIAPNASSETLSKAAQPLVVNTVSGKDDIWDSSARSNLRYCVSNEFGTLLKPRVVSEMRAATAAWEGAANVRFVYEPTQDANCVSTNPLVVIPVRPSIGNGAYAFIGPSQTYCSGSCRVLAINYSWYDNQGAESYKSTTGVLTHEVGHILGFRHEHARPDSDSYGACATNDDTLPSQRLTPYDRTSVMHYPYPQCPNGAHADMALSLKDRQAAAILYGPGTSPVGSNPMDDSEWFVWQLYRDVLHRYPDAGGFAVHLNGLQNCSGNQTCLDSVRVATARSLFESSEHRQQHPELDPNSPNYKAAYINNCYTHFLRRSHDPGQEGSNWMDILNTTGDYNTVIRGFITSAEYRSRFM
ncbi:M12 family metallopeptidase [Archangium lansingense]|uniref:M12 family metallopeptidase n=1 Tax=Archangium lansingense TaxID=2995310 RepID=UPI003B7935C1